MGEYADLSHYQYSQNGSDSHNLLITALYNDTEIYVVEEDGTENLVDCLDAYESIILRVDIPKTTKQYLGFRADGEFFIYDINRDNINVADWIYLTE